MLHDDVQQGVSRAAEALGVDAQVIEQVSDAIASEAVTDPKGRKALTLSREGEQVIHYHMFKAITAAASVLGAVAGIAVPVTLVSVLSAIGALGSLQGLREPLPQASATIVDILYSENDKEMSKEVLLRKFEQGYNGPLEEMKMDFDNGLKALEGVKSIRVERETVRLIELIVIRL